MTLNEIARKMCAKGKGIIAADESTGTIAKRFKSIKMKWKFNNKNMRLGPAAAIRYLTLGKNRGVVPRH